MRKHMVMARNTSGVSGILWNRQANRWQAQVVKRYPGRFPTKEAAQEARQRAEEGAIRRIQARRLPYPIAAGEASVYRGPDPLLDVAARVCPAESRRTAAVLQRECA
jgi:hypothetical protein